MSTIDNSLEIDNKLSETQIKLINGKFKKDLKLYQKNSMNKINFRSFIGHNFITSTPDKFKKIRIPLVSLFIKILSNKTPTNIQRLNKLKSFIYSQKLYDLVQKHGIPLQQLMSNFVFAINQLQMGSLKIQSQFIKKINSQPFFDKIIMQSFYSSFINSNNQNSLTSNISKWIKQQIGISLVFVQNQIDDQNQNIICLRKNQKNQIFRILKSFNVCSMTSIFDQEKDCQTPIKNNRNDKQINRQFIQQNLLKSISSCESPTFTRGSKKNHQNLVPISLQNSLQLIQSNKQNKYTQQKAEPQDQSQPIQKRKLQNQQSQRKFWKIFCCGGD